MEEKNKPKHHPHSFSAFLDDPLVSLLILTFGLVTLFFAILEFTQAMAY